MNTLTEWMAVGQDNATCLSATGAKPLSYQGLRRLAGTVQTSLNAVGIGRDDRVAIVLPNGADMATAFVTAARASSPLVAFCGEYPVSDDEYTQALDQSAFAHGCEAAFVRMGTPQDADEAVRKAFYIARTQSRPVLLSVPMDLQQKEWEDDEPYMPSTAIIPKRTVSPNEGAIKLARFKPAATAVKAGFQLGRPLRSSPRNAPSAGRRSACGYALAQRRSKLASTRRNSSRSPISMSA